MEILYLLMAILMCLLCFVSGYVLGLYHEISKLAYGKSEPKERVKVDILKPIREHRAKKEAEKEQDKLDTIMRNIEAYDGTGNGQSDVPRG
jgi:hypothetical protein